MKNTPIKILAWFLVLLVGGCVDPYRPPEVTSPNSYLVVNGFFDSAPGSPTTIRLSRTQNLADTKAPTVETKAVVTIESQNKAVYTLAEGTAGTYTLAGVTPRTGENYRLHIRTAKGVEYFSAYVPVIQTPPIDSISWRKEADGVQISVNAHDPTNNTRYYRYEFDETWEYYSAYTSNYELINNQLVSRDVRVDQCWSNASSTNIMTTSTTRLSQDVVSQFPLTFVPAKSEKLWVKYSILVRQIALSQMGFEYYDQLAKITQNIGSIFDPQPSQITGNLYCTTNSNELVLGFFRAGSVATKRIFISRSQVPEFRAITGYEGCETDTLTLAEIRKDQPAIITMYDMTRYLTTTTYCVDCRLRGGVIKRPDFWQ